MRLKFVEKILNENLSFVYLYCCDKFGVDTDFQTWLIDYKDWLKNYNSKKES